MTELNLMTWFGQRELEYCPKHFIKTNTPLTTESHLWILEKLQGRFYIKNSKLNLFVTDENFVYFEDPHEAILYELSWS